MEMKSCKMEVEKLVIVLVEIYIDRVGEVYVETTDMFLDVKKDLCVEAKFIVLKKTEVVLISKIVVRPESWWAVDNTKIVPEQSIMNSRETRHGGSTEYHISDKKYIEIVDTSRPNLAIEDITVKWVQQVELDKMFIV